MSRARVLPLLDHLRRDGDVSLAALAARVGRSRFELHRVFRRFAGETPKQYALRVRLDGAAAELLRGDRTILDIALAAGFSSHEVFLRAFRRRFGATPRDYRARGRRPGPVLERHADVVRGVSPCIGVYHCTDQPRETTTMTTPEVTIRQLTPQPALVMRRRAAQSEIAATLGEILPAVFTHAQRAGIPLAGPPFTRYLSGGPGLFSLEAGMAIAGPAQPTGEIEVAELPGGPAAVAVHVGAYDSLGQTHAAIERWIADHGHAVVGAPWEVYVTDPGEQPNPADWRTEVLYPIREASRGS